MRARDREQEDCVPDEEISPLREESANWKDDVDRLQSQLEDELAASVAGLKADLYNAKCAVKTFKNDLNGIIRQTYEVQFKRTSKKYKGSINLCGGLPSGI